MSGGAAWGQTHFAWVGASRISAAALPANKAVRPRRKTGTGPTESLIGSDPA